MKREQMEIQLRQSAKKQQDKRKHELFGIIEQLKDELSKTDNKAELQQKIDELQTEFDSIV